VFEYTVGKVKFTQGGQAPSKNNVKTFLEGALPMIERQGYQANVWGRTLYDAKNTVDFDLALTGTITDYNALEQLFYDLFSYGYLEARIILDLKWLSDMRICELNSNGEPVFQNVDKIIIRYCRLLTDKVNRKDEYVYPKWTRVSEWLVKSNYKDSEPLSKPHQIAHVKQHGRFQSVPAREFLKNIDLYLD
jgi:hypothetical protein